MTWSACAAAARAPNCPRMPDPRLEDNAAARALYFRCGFRDSHRYHYMLAP